MQDGSKNTWSGTCHKENKNGEGGMHKIVTLSECIKAILYDILVDLFGILRIPRFVNHKGKDINSDWFSHQWDE